MTQVQNAGRYLRQRMSPFAIALLALITAIAFTIPFLVAERALGDHVIPGPASGNGVTPSGVHGNPDCADLLDADDFLFEHKTGVPTDATIPLSFDGLTGSLTIDVHGDSTFDFSFSGDFVAAAVIVKGGPNANFYDYRPDGEDADTGLHAPVNPSNDKFFGLSHISFCIAEAGADLEITKTAVDDTITVGERAAFDITVTSLGPGTAQNVTIDDELPNTVLDWEIVSEDIAGACSVTGGNTLHCDVGNLTASSSFAVRVQTTAPIALGSDRCGDTLNNTAFADADNADVDDDDATISVVCGAIEVNKFAKVPGSTDTQPIAGAGFTLFDNGTAIDPPGQVTTGADGVACFDGLPVDSEFRLSETTIPTGYAAVADRQVTSSADNADCLESGTPTTVNVENMPLTDIAIDVTAQVPGATNSTIVCADEADTEIGNSGVATDPASLDVNDLAPGTYTCTIVIDP